MLTIPVEKKSGVRSYQNDRPGLYSILVALKAIERLQAGE